MLDPFFAPNPALTAWVTPLSAKLHLHTLPLHIHEILSAFILYHTVFTYLAPHLSSLFLPKTYTALSYESRLRWNMHCASMIQSCAICTISLYTILYDTERKSMNLEERLWGYTGAAGLVQALATGYFLFDFVVMVRYTSTFGYGMLAHGFCCFVTYVLGFRPVGNYYGCAFMLYELSTPFLNIHWFFDKLGMTGTKAQLYNGLLLLVVFFSCRLVWGAYASACLYKDVWNVWFENNFYDPENMGEMVMKGSREEIMRFGMDRSLPGWLVLLYGVGHAVLQGLNIWWFGKMIEAVSKRFVKPKVEKKAL